MFGLLGDWLGPARVCLIQGVGVVALAGYFLVLAPREGELHAVGPETDAEGREVPCP